MGRFGALRFVAGAMAVLMATLIVLGGAAADASAAPPPAVSLQQAEREMQRIIDKSIREDAEGFEERVSLLQDSEATWALFEETATEYVTALEQAQAMAATADREVIKGLVYGAEQGWVYLSEVDGQTSLVVDNGTTTKSGSSEGYQTYVEFPQCPAAFAAFAGWLIVKRPYCYAVGTFGFWWGVACAGAMMAAGGVIDYNASC